MSTPNFLDNSLLNAYLIQMDSRWKEEATKMRLYILVLLGEKEGQVLDNWQHVVEAMPKAPI